MDLYCDNGGDPTGSNCPNAPIKGGPGAQFHGETEAHCLRQAKAHGWLIRDANTVAICPACAKTGAVQKRYG